MIDENKLEQLEKEFNDLKLKVDGSILLTKEQFYDIMERLLGKNSISYNEIKSNIITGTTSGTADTETTHAHNLSREPSFVFITSTLGGVVYLTDKDGTNIKVKSPETSITFQAFCLI